MTSYCPCCLQAVPENKVLIDYSSNFVTYNGITIYASRNEIDLLGFLLARTPRAVTHDEMMHAVWGNSEPDTALKSIQVMICVLRKKLTPEMGLKIETVYRRGYRLVKTASLLDPSLRADPAPAQLHANGYRRS